jgi:uncharacterized membrane protein
MKIFVMLPGLDWLALIVFFGLWSGYAWFALARGRSEQTLLSTTNRLRQRWMVQATRRDPRMLDGLITQNLSQTPAFFSSTSIIIIGGLFALLGTTDKAAELVREIPFAQPTPMLVFEFKVLVLIGIFVYAFFRFSWSMRLYTFVALALGAMAPVPQYQADPEAAEAEARQTAALVSTAAETFNDGLRAYYFSFAAMAWFFSPLALILATALVVAILYRREFRSEVLQILRH